MDHQSVFKSTLPMCEQGHIQCMWYQLKDAQSRRLGILVKDTLIHEILSTLVGGGGGGGRGMWLHATESGISSAWFWPLR